MADASTTYLPETRTLANCRELLFARVGAVQQDGWLPDNLNLNRGPIRGLIELWAWGLYALYLFIDLILGQGFPERATGLWLDLHATQVGLTRQAATKAEGSVVFYRDDATAGNVVIAKGLICKTPADGAGEIYRFVTTEAAILKSGETEVEVPVLAETYGTGSNVTAGQIRELATPVTGIDGVRNDADWLTSEGADKETDDALRERYFLRWLEQGGCTKYAYESWARRATGVIAVTILDQHPRGQGTVDIVVKGAAGIPTEELLEAVRAEIEPEYPVNDDWEVRGPDAVSVTIEAELVLLPDYEGEASEIASEVEIRFRALFTDPSPVDDIEALQIGHDLTLDRLAHEALAVDGIKRVNWTSPEADVAVAEDALAVLDSLTLTTAVAGDA